MVLVMSIYSNGIDLILACCHFSNKKKINKYIKGINLENIFRNFFMKKEKYKWFF